MTRVMYVSVFECWILSRVPPILGDTPIVLDRNKAEVSLGSGPGNDLVIKEGFSAEQLKFVR